MPWGVGMPGKFWNDDTILSWWMRPVAWLILGLCWLVERFHRYSAKKV